MASERERDQKIDEGLIDSLLLQSISTISSNPPRFRDASMRRCVRSTEEISQTIVDVISKNVFKIVHRRARTQILERNIRFPTAQRHAHDA